MPLTHVHINYLLMFLNTTRLTCVFFFHLCCFVVATKEFLLLKSVQSICRMFNWNINFL